MSLLPPTTTGDGAVKSENGADKVRKSLKADKLQACRNRLQLAGILTHNREIASKVSNDDTNRTECVVSFDKYKKIHQKRINCTSKANRQRKPGARRIASIKSLFSPILYQCNRTHKYTNEPIPNIPPPWTKLNPPVKESTSPVALEDIEDGEIYEAHKQSPSPILPILDDVIPPEYCKSKLLHEYIYKVKKSYLDAKSARQKWQCLRDNFKSENFQALVNDYLADCQMRRDRGEITDEECHLNSSMVLALLFGQQVAVETQFIEAERNLQICYDYLKNLNTSPEYARASRFIPEEEVLSVLNGRSHHLQNAYFDRVQVESPGIRRPPSHVSDDSYESEGLELVKNYEERLRISRALDQRAPFTRRHFNGKLTTFNEARATDRRGDSSLEPSLIRNSDPVIQHSMITAEDEQPSLLVGSDPINFPPEDSIKSSGSLNSLKGFIAQCINEDRQYCKRISRISLFADEELTRARSPGEKCFEQRKHSLFGNYPSTGRKKFEDEEAMISDDDDYQPVEFYRKRRLKVHE